MNVQERSRLSRSVRMNPARLPERRSHHQYRNQNADPEKTGVPEMRGGIETAKTASEVAAAPTHLRDFSALRRLSRDLVARPTLLEHADSARRLGTCSDLDSRASRCGASTDATQSFRWRVRAERYLTSGEPLGLARAARDEHGSEGARSPG